MTFALQNAKAWELEALGLGYFKAQRLTKSMSKAPARTMVEAPGEAGMIGGVMVFAPLGFAVFAPTSQSRRGPHGKS